MGKYVAGEIVGLGVAWERCRRVQRPGAPRDGRGRAGALPGMPRAGSTVHAPAGRGTPARRAARPDGNPTENAAHSGTGRPRPRARPREKSNPTRKSNVRSVVSVRVYGIFDF